MKTAQSRQKSYADVQRRDREYEVVDHMFIKVTPMKGQTRFGVKGKLAPRYVGPYEILEALKHEKCCACFPSLEVRLLGMLLN